MAKSRFKTEEDIIFNKCVGEKIRIQRQALKISIVKISKAIGITYQQFSKYERGEDSIKPINLKKIAKLIKLPISYLFDDVKEELTPEETALRKAAAEISRDFMLIKSAASRHAAKQNVKILAENK